MGLPLWCTLPRFRGTSPSVRVTPRVRRSVGTVPRSFHSLRYNLGGLVSSVTDWLSFPGLSCDVPYLLSESTRDELVLVSILVYYQQIRQFKTTPNDQSLSIVLVLKLGKTGSQDGMDYLVKRRFPSFHRNTSYLEGSVTTRSTSLLFEWSENLSTSTLREHITYYV